MNSDVYKILYCSKNLIEGEDAKREAEITQILQTARRKNKEQNVTGALLFNSGYFAQALEGPRLAIEQIFERIQRDPRHGDVTVLSSQTDGHRDFPEWSMAYVAPPGGGRLARIGFWYPRYRFVASRSFSRRSTRSAAIAGDAGRLTLRRLAGHPADVRATGFEDSCAPGGN